jgi:hypothetical protein
MLQANFINGIAIGVLGLAILESLTLMMAQYLGRKYKQLSRSVKEEERINVIRSGYGEAIPMNILNGKRHSLRPETPSSPTFNPIKTPEYYTPGVGKSLRAK